MKRRSCVSSGGLSTFRLVRLSEPVLALTHPGIIAALTSVFLMKIRQHVFAHAIVGSVTPRGSEIFGIHGAANGAAVGGAIGGGQGLIGGAGRGQGRADQQANQQMGALALPSTEVRHDFTVSGYVFFPKGDYKQLQVLLVDGETGDTEVIDRPWK